VVGFNRDLTTQIKLLEQILNQNTLLYSVIKKSNEIGLQYYYIGAGCITQTVWNYQCGFELTNGISDIDFVYYEDFDLSFEAENSTIERINKIIKQSEIKLDIKNQARVHLWYKDRFGYEIKPYDSVESAINTWPTTATAVGVRIEDDALKVYAPFGLNDLFGMIVKANKAQITEGIYLEKIEKWSAIWSALTIIPW
jgi:hypothetical protein